MSQVEELQRKLLRTRNVNERVTLLNSLSRETYRTNPRQAIEYANQALELATSQDKRAMAQTLATLGACHLMLADYPVALSHCLASHRIFQELQIANREVAALLMSIGYAYMRQGKYLEALDAFRKSLAVHDDEEEGERERRAKTLSDIGDVYTEMGDYVTALEYLHQSLALRQESDRTTDAGSLLNSIANLYFNTGDFDKADEFYSKGLRAFQEAGDAAMEAVVLGNIGLIYRVRGDYETAIAYLEKSLELCRSIGNKEGETRAYVNLGDIHEQREELDIALEYLNKASKLAESIGDRRAFAAALGTIGAIYLRKNRAKDCITVVEQALGVAAKTGNRQITYELHEILSQAYEAGGDMENALKHYKVFTTTKEEIQGQAKQRTIDEMQMRVQVERSEKEREIIQLKNVQLEMEIDHKTRELASSALHIVQKNEFLSKLTRRIAQIRTEGSGTREALLDDLQREVDLSIGAPEDWDALENQFNQIHSDFIRSLSTQYPSLTPAELKVCSLIKLNLSTKEIGRLLCISNRSAENHRYHIRQKLNLPVDVNLTTYLAGF
ncbi:MAG: LuxR family transcriptional regulator [Bacteroidetes bacterium]|nr:LuxR family transcriptional regulator [Bacteroidota bacterium]